MSGRMQERNIIEKSGKGRKSDDIKVRVGTAQGSTGRNWLWRLWEFDAGWVIAALCVARRFSILCEHISEFA
jgi:hypothetical protein